MTELDTIHAQFKLNYPGFGLDIDVTMPARGVTALFGQSGSGKSTILRCIAGLEKAEGELIVKGEIWQNATLFLPPHQRPIGYVFQEATLFPHLTVMANLNYGFKRQPQKHNGFSLDHAIDLLGIEHLLKRKPARLSGGEKQRVAIARALAVNPKLLLMDEPLAALDISRKREILPFLEKLHDELDMPVIYVTHSPNEVSRLADHMVILKNGQVEASGSLNETIAHLEHPVQQGDKAGVIIEANIAMMETNWHLALAKFKGGQIWIRDMDFELGMNIRFRIMASDVSISLNAEHDSSISNVIPAVIEDISEGNHPSIAIARLRVGENFILSRLTKRSLHTLGVAVGDQVWAQIKSAAIVE